MRKSATWLLFVYATIPFTDIVDPSYKGENETESNAGISIQIEDLRTMLGEAVLKMEETCLPPKCLDSHNLPSGAMNY
jgi:hypothetical protein